MPEPVRVTAVVVAGRQRGRAANALGSLLEQAGGERLAVVLVDAAPEGTAPLPGADDPRVTTLLRPRRGAFGALRAEAVRCATGDVVAFLEEHATALPGWLEGIEAVFGSADVGAAGGAVEAANAGVGISDVVSVMNYARWLPPVAANPDADVVVGHNAAYRRDDLLAFGDRLDALLSSEVVLQRALRARGRRLVVDPRIGIAHANETTTRSISRGYHLWNLAFGEVWAETERWTAVRRWAQAIGIPWWVLRRITDMVRQAPPAHRRVLLRHLPSVVVAQTAGALGIAQGALRGAGDATVRFTDYEIDIEREAAPTRPV